MTRTQRGIALGAGIIAATLLSAAPAAAPSQRKLTWSARCPIDVIFPLRVDADRARQLKLVPARYRMVTGPDGKVVMVVSLLYCDRSTVNGVAAGRAIYHDLLLQIEPPFGTATVPPDHQLDGYWRWVVTNQRRLHKALSRLGMHNPFDRHMRVQGTWSDGPFGRRLESLTGRVTWPSARFHLKGSVLDTAVPEGSDMRFWHDVRRGVLRSRLVRAPGAEEGSLAHYTLTTAKDSLIGRVLEEQCTEHPTRPRFCRISGPGFVTHIVGEFVHNVQVRRASAW